MHKKIINEPGILYSFLGISLAFFAISVVVFINLKFFAGIILFGISVGLLYLLFTSYKKCRSEAKDEIASVIWGHLKQDGLNVFNLEQICDIYDFSEKDLDNACEAVYAKCIEKALVDFQITEKERKALDVLAEKLGVNLRTAQNIEKNAKQEKYKEQLDRRMADGVITPKESQELQDLRIALELTDKEAFEGAKSTVIDGYRALFRRFARDGILTEEEFRELQDYAAATGLSPAEACQISKKEAVDLYRRTVSMICQDGIISAEEKQNLTTLENMLKLSVKDIGQYRQAIIRLERFSKIRQGDIPTIQPKEVMLRAAELCYIQEKCSYSYLTPGGSAREYYGELVVTNERVLFHSPERSFDFRPGKILNICARERSIELKCESNKGQGEYRTSDPEMLGIILETLARKHKFSLEENANDYKSRHISDCVKATVWQRDNGQCVKCGANDYLEYDHIIPFSRGGANSENNIQLLCRKCNLSKVIICFDFNNLAIKKASKLGIIVANVYNLCV